METLEELGRYRVLAPIGRGGMGTVFAGHHVVLQRPVAIKVLHAHLATESAMARRMLEEAQTIAGLQHPGIVEVLDVGMTGDGRTYVVMERLVGEALGDRLMRGRLSEERAVAFARQLASALAVAHAAGVVHRDLKPDNIFIIPDPDVAGGERVKILDFGIAKRVTVPRESREQTQTGVVLGTPAYMAPEQCTGNTDLDGRADIYALGVVMYLMVTGELPFDGASTEEIFAEHVFCAPRPPAALAPVSPHFAMVIDRCMAKRPSDRYDSMDALALELEILQAPAASDTSAAMRATTSVPHVALPLPAAPESTRHIAHSGRHVVATANAITRATTTPVMRVETEPSAPQRRWWHGAVLTASAIGVGVAAALLVRTLAGPGAGPAVATAAVREIAPALVAPPVAAEEPRKERAPEKIVAEKRERARDERAREDRAERSRVARERNREDRAERAREESRTDRTREERSERRTRVAAAEEKRMSRDRSERRRKSDSKSDRPERAEPSKGNGASSHPSFAKVAPPTLY